MPLLPHDQILRPAYLGSLALGCGSVIGMSIVVAATFPARHAANENVTLALPGPASAGTRTGPWKMLPQQTRPKT
jgi:hypothetical protein